MITSPGAIFRVSAAVISPRTLQAVSGEVRSLTGEFWNPELCPNGMLPGRGGPLQAGGRIAGTVVSKISDDSFSYTVHARGLPTNIGALIDTVDVYRLLLYIRSCDPFDLRRTYPDKRVSLRKGK